METPDDRLAIKTDANSEKSGYVQVSPKGSIFRAEVCVDIQKIQPEACESPKSNDIQIYIPVLDANLAENCSQSDCPPKSGEISQLEIKNTSDVEMRAIHKVAILESAISDIRVKRRRMQDQVCNINFLLILRDFDSI